MSETTKGEPSSFTIFDQRVAAERADPGLHVVATPIGNLRDMTIRGLATLAGVEQILAEDTRVSGVLLARYAIDTPLAPYHEHNAAAARPRILARLRDGAALALISDAGTPLVSDPGYKLVAQAVAEGIAVHALPGPSAALAALVVSGLPSDRFFFEGFLPTRDGARRTRLEALAAIPATLIFYESPRRLAESLADLAEAFGAREAAVARELTKFYEEVRRGPLTDLARRAADEPPPKGEIVIVVGPPGVETATRAPDAADDLLRAALQTHSIKDAATIVAAQTGQPRRSVYARAIALSTSREP